MKRRAGWFLAVVGVIAVIMAIGLFVRGPGQADAGWLVQFTGVSTYALIHLLVRGAPSPLLGRRDGDGPYPRDGS